MTFHDWLEQKYIEWMARERRRKTISAFADWVGVSQSMMTRYMNGQMMPTGENIDKLATQLGPEVYDLLGLARPDDDLKRLTHIWDKLTPEEKDYIIKQAEKYANESTAPQTAIYPKTA